jgi:hypothetical protein
MPQLSREGASPAIFGNPVEHDIEAIGQRAGKIRVCG